MLRFRDLGASFSSFGCFVFEIWVLRFRDLVASCFGLRFRVLRFRNYPKDGKHFDADGRLISSASFHTSPDNCERSMQK